MWCVGVVCWCGVGVVMFCFVVLLGWVSGSCQGMVLFAGKGGLMCRGMLSMMARPMGGLEMEMLQCQPGGIGQWRCGGSPVRLLWT